MRRREERIRRILDKHERKARAAEEAEIRRREENAEHDRWVAKTIESLKDEEVLKTIRAVFAATANHPRRPR